MTDYKKTVAQLKNNLHTLQQREAKYGGDAPVALLNQITDHQQAIALTEQALAGKLTETEWREALRPLNIDHTLIEGSFFQKVLKALSLSGEQQRELRNREIMLQRVHDFWVKGVLENSLHNEVLIELGMETKPEAVDYPWDMVVQRPDQSNRTLTPGTKMIDVFDESGGSLLILGEPGSGKTTMLLDLCRQLIERAQTDWSQPIPVVFNLSFWGEKRLPLAEWLIEELYARYSISRELARRWVQNDDLLPLLDGLDEVASLHRDACVSAINRFYQDKMSKLVVCCRKADYADLSTRLRLQHSVLLQPLTPEQVDLFLRNIVPNPGSLQMAIGNDTRLQKLACSPLMLSMMALVFQDIPNNNAFQSSQSITIYRKQLFDAYINHMFKHRKRDAHYSSEHTVRWLSWLAKKMKNHNQVNFYVEQMQVSWLSAQRQNIYYFSLRFMGGLTFFIIGVLGAFLSVGWVNLMQVGSQIIPFGPVLTVGLAAGLCFVFSSIFAVRWWIVPLTVITVGGILALTRWSEPMIGLVGGIVFGLPGAIAGAPLAQRRAIQITDAFNWSWRNIGWGILFAVGVGLVAGILSSNDKLINALQISLPVGLILVLVLGLRRVEHIHTRTRPNQGLYRSIHHSYRIGCSSSLIVLLIGALVSIIQGNPVTGIALGIVLGSLIGLAVGFYAGGNDVLQHGALRFWLYKDKKIPWHLVDFLDYSVDHIFLRRVGHGYIFVHQWLQEHFITQGYEERS